MDIEQPYDSFSFHVTNDVVNNIQGQSFTQWNSQEGNPSNWNEAKAGFDFDTNLLQESQRLVRDGVVISQTNIDLPKDGLRGKLIDLAKSETAKLWQGATEFVLDAARNRLIQHVALHLGGIPFMALKDPHVQDVLAVAGGVAVKILDHPQVQGTLYVVGGVGEIAVGVPLAVLTIETGIGFYGGLLLAGHGIDQIIKGSSQILTNQKQRSITTAVLEQFRVPSEWAENIDDIVGAGGGLIGSSRLLMKVGDDVLEVTVKELGKESAGSATQGVRGEVKLVDKSNVKPHVEGGDFGKKVDINVKLGALDPYLEAMNGGRHAPWAKEYLDKPTKEIEKGIKSLDKQMKLHEDKISNPRKHIPNWDDLPQRQRDRLVQVKWPNDIARQKEQKNILEGILGGRNGK